jgi:TolA-binding protein/thiol-disulfide isomerase/thioredoxin
VAAGGPNEKAQGLLNELEKLDAAVNRATDAESQAPLNAKRADLLEQLAAEATKPEDRAAWVRQMADVVSAAVQSGGYPDGVKRLEALLERLRKNEEDGALAAYVRFRQLTAEYGLAVQAKGADFAKVQTEWLKKLEQYVVDYPKSPDAAEAMLQLALGQEFAGQEDEARKWYGQIVRGFPEAPVAKKAAGARNRLDSVGKVLELQGKGTSGEVVELAKLRGKVVLVQYWATWSEPSKADMAVLKDLLDKHGSSGFAVIGVNLDTNTQAMSAFLTENKLPWAQIHEEGGLESRPAVELGILTLPTMILVDREGKVVNRNIGTSELVGELKKLIR